MFSNAEVVHLTWRKKYLRLKEEEGCGLIKNVLWNECVLKGIGWGRQKEGCLMRWWEGQGDLILGRHKGMCVIAASEGVNCIMNAS